MRPDTSAITRRQTVIVVSAVAFTLGAAVGWGRHWPSRWIAAEVITAIVAGATAAAVASPRIEPRARRGRQVGQMVVACVIVTAFGVAGVARGSLAAIPASIATAVGAATSSSVLTGVVSSTESPGTVVDLTSSGRRADTPLEGRVLVSGRSLPVLVVGDVVELQVTRLVGPSRRPGMRSMEALARDGIDAIADVSGVSVTGVDPGLPRAAALLRDTVRHAVDAQLPAPFAALVLGIGLGIHEPVDTATRTALQDAGLYHIVAVSGLKVIILAGLVDAVTAATGWPRRRRRVVALITIAAYVLLSGAGAAALRTSVMAGLVVALERDRRRLNRYVGLALVAAALTALQPRITADVGFQLSFLGTAGIVLLARPFAARIPGPRLIVEPLAVTLAAQLATAPIIAATFGVVSLGGPIANALGLPLLPAAVALSIVGSLLAPVAAPLAWHLLHGAALCAALLVALSRLIDLAPMAALHPGQWPGGWVGAEIVALATAAGAATVLRGRLAGERLVAATVVIAAVAGIGASVLSGLPGTESVAILDVGGGTAVLITTASGHTVLINSGGSASAIVTALGRVLPPTTNGIDLLVLTAGAKTAVGGDAGLAQHYRIGRVVVGAAVPAAADVAAFASAGAPVVAAGEWRWDDLAMRCVGADPDVPQNGCLLLVRSSVGWTALISGVAPPAQQDAVADQLPTAAPQLLVAPPGGALDQALVDLLHPGLVAEPLAAGRRPLLVSGAAVLSTGGDGDLIFTVIGGRLTHP